MDSADKMLGKTRLNFGKHTRQVRREDVTMASKRKAPTTYKAAHRDMKGMSLKDIAAALQEELMRPEPRVDLVARLIGRYNRADGARRVREVMSLLNKRGRRDVRAALASNR